MAFRLGVLAAIVAYRRRNGKTRLKTLQQSLNNKHCSVLYQYPAKKIFSILFFIALIIGMQWLISQFQSELNQIKVSMPTTHSTFLEPVPPGISQLNLSNRSHQEIQNNLFYNKIQQISYVVRVLHLLFAILIASLIYHLQVRVVTPIKKHSKISCTTYALVKPSKKEEIQVLDGDRLVICEMGESRVTNTNYYYSLRIVGSNKDKHIINKSCMFDARVAAIKLAHQLQIPFSTKVIKRSRSADQYEQQY